MKTIYLPEIGDKLLYEGAEYVIESVDDIADYYNDDACADYQIRFKSTHGIGTARLDDLTWNGEVFVASEASLPVHGPTPKPRERSAFEKVLIEVWEPIIMENFQRSLDDFEMMTKKSVTWNGQAIVKPPTERVDSNP